MRQPEFKLEKFRELVLYIAVRSETLLHFGKTKLNKQLYFSDSRAYRELGSAITGAEYRKATFGPVAAQLPFLLAQLEEDHSAVVRRSLVPGRREQQRVIALRAPQLNVFTAPEIAIVDGVLEELAPMDTDTVSAYSHEDAGWKLSTMGEIIPYGMSMAPDPDDPDDLESMVERCRLKRA